MRISLEKGGTVFCALPIRCASDQLAQESFHIPVQVVLKVEREPVEQFGMARLLAHTAEVFESFDDPCPK